MFSKELRQFAHSLVHILRHPICLDVPCAGDEIQFLVVRPRGFAETLFGHIERVGKTARHHQERLVDEVHPFAGIKRHQVHQTAFGIAEGGAGMRVCLEVILIAVAVEVKRELLRLLRRDAAHIAHIFRCFAVCLLLTGGTGIGETLLHIIHLRIKETIAPHQSGVEHTERSDRLEAFVRLRGFQRIAATAADAEDADAVGIHSGILRQDVGGTVSVSCAFTAHTPNRRANIAKYFFI